MKTPPTAAPSPPPSDTDRAAASSSTNQGAGRPDLSQLARLARLNLSDEEQAVYAHKLDSLLALVDTLKAVDTRGVTPMSHACDIQLPLRVDQVTESHPREALQAIAPSVEQGLYRVPRVIAES